MSEEEKNTEEKQGKSPLGIILVLFAILAIVLGYGLYNNAQKAGKTITAENVVTSDETTEADTAQTDAAEDADIDTASAESTTDLSPVIPELDIEALSTPRILGDVNAPVKISEHSSFTCGHCGAFHASNFKKIKEEYIQTGKAYIVFDDFPRNRPDLLIGAIARCVPEQSYFNFVQLVFETQKDWISDKDYIDYIKQNAKLAGADMAKIEACYESEALQTKMAERREAAHKNHNVNSTPTLIINDSVNIGGMDTYEKVKAAIDAAYEASKKVE